MFVTLSKLMHWLVEPATWLVGFQVLGLALLWRGWHRAARGVLAFSILLAIAVFYLPTGALLVRPLEQAFPRPRELPAQIDGIIALGGAMNAELTNAYGRARLNADAERLTDFIALARTHPEARLVYSGDWQYVERSEISEAQAAAQLFSSLGFDPARVIFEDKSRNTHESAVYTHALLKPKAGENWVLITSAAHMPRAYGSFRKAGWDVIPYPVAYRAKAASGRGEDEYATLLAALHEWVGIAVYRLTGRM